MAVSGVVTQCTERRARHAEERERERERGDDPGRCAGRARAEKDFVSFCRRARKTTLTTTPDQQVARRAGHTD